MPSVRKRGRPACFETYPKSLPFFYCPSCGVAWDKISNVVDDVHSFADFAPCGATRASRADLENEGIQSFILVVRDAPEDILLEN